MQESLARSRYPSRVPDLRRIAATALKRVLESSLCRSLHDCLCRLWDARDALQPSFGHKASYVAAVLEAASEDKNQDSAREFARTFLNRPSSYSNTPAGLSALMLETMLARKGLSLLGRFVETVVDSNDSYLIVFDGPLNQREMDLLREQTVRFIESFKVLVAHGQTNDDNMVSDLTILEAFPTKKLKPSDAEPATPELRPGAPGTPETRRDELLRARDAALRPRTESEYRQVVTEDGLSSGSMASLFGSRFVPTECEDGVQMVDDNDVRWLRMHESDRWIPCVDERMKPVGRNPADLTLWRSAMKLAMDAGRSGAGALAWAAQWYENQGGLWEDDYRRGADRSPPGFVVAPESSAQACLTCAYFDSNIGRSGGNCDNFNVDVKPTNLCDAWDGNVGGGPGESVDVVDATVTLFESPQPNLIRSLCGSWAVFVTEDADGGGSVTIIVAEDRAWAVDQSFAKVTDVVMDIASSYGRDTLWAADRCVEHALAEFGADVGSEVDNLAEVIAVASPNWIRLVERADSISALVEASAGVKPAPKKPANGGPEKTATDKKAAQKDPPKPAPKPTGTAAPDAPDEETDRSEDPEFYRDDLQNYYDIQFLSGVDPDVAVRKVKQRFKVKELTVLPTGEVRSPGVVDRPAPPPPTLPPEAPPEPTPPESDAGGAVTVAVGGNKPAPEGSSAAQETVLPPVLRKCVESSGLPEADVLRLWQAAGTRVPPHAGLPHRAQHRVDTFDRMLSVAVESSRPAPRSIDDALHRWVESSDVGGSVDFESWLADTHPEFLSHLSHWSPTNLHESLDRRPAPHLSDELAERYEKWRRLLNMTNAEIRSMHRHVREATTSLSVGGLRAFTLGKRSARRLLAMRSTPVKSWTDEDWSWASRQINTVSRLRAQPGALFDGQQPTEKLLLLRAWGHDPRLRSKVSESVVLVGQRRDWRCRSCKALVVESSVSYSTASEAWMHSCGAKLIVPEADDDARREVNRCVIDPTPGVLPCLISEDEPVPPFKDLKSGQVKLTDAERSEVMKKKAVWHHGPKGAASPAVWKSIVDGKTYFVTNTHRAYNVRPTLAGAIGRYHSFIKGTA